MISILFCVLLHCGILTVTGPGVVNIIMIRATICKTVSKPIAHSVYPACAQCLLHASFLKRVVCETIPAFDSVRPVGPGPAKPAAGRPGEMARAAAGAAGHRLSLPESARHTAPRKTLRWPGSHGIAESGPGAVSGRGHSIGNRWSLIRRLLIFFLGEYLNFYF